MTNRTTKQHQLNLLTSFADLTSQVVKSKNKYVTHLFKKLKKELHGCFTTPTSSFLLPNIACFNVCDFWVPRLPPPPLPTKPLPFEGKPDLLRFKFKVDDSEDCRLVISCGEAFRFKLWCVVLFLIPSLRSPPFLLARQPVCFCCFCCLCCW